MFQLHTVFEDVSAATAFDVLMDPDYRSNWDDASVRDFDICKLDGYNDIGYYASKYYQRKCILLCIIYIYPEGLGTHVQGL